MCKSSTLSREEFEKEVDDFLETAKNAKDSWHVEFSQVCRHLSTISWLDAPLDIRELVMPTGREWELQDVATKYTLKVFVTEKNCCGVFLWCFFMANVDFNVSK